jgi:hypothetical protein
MVDIARLNVEQHVWLLAIAAARDGDPAELAALLRQSAPPDLTVCNAIADLLEPSRARFTPHQVAQIRRLHRALTSDVPGDPANPTDPAMFPRMSDLDARVVLAEILGAKPDTIKDVIRGEHSYRRYGKPRTMRDYGENSTTSSPDKRKR